jgi:hypothetical protein
MELIKEGIDPIGAATSISKIITKVRDEFMPVAYFSIPI